MQLHEVCLVYHVRKREETISRLCAQFPYTMHLDQNVRNVGVSTNDFFNFELANLLFLHSGPAGRLYNRRKMMTYDLS